MRSDSIEKPVQNISGSSARRAPLRAASSSRRRARRWFSWTSSQARSICNRAIFKFAFPSPLPSPGGRGRNRGPLPRGEGGKPLYGRLERLAPLAERKAHVRLPVLGIVVEHRRRDRRDADLFGQVPREHHVVVESERPEVGADEVGALRGLHPEADPRELPGEVVALAAIVGVQGGVILRPGREPGGGAVLERRGRGEGDELVRGTHGGRRAPAAPAPSRSSSP